MTKMVLMLLVLTNFIIVPPDLLALVSPYSFKSFPCGIFEIEGRTTTTQGSGLYIIICICYCCCSECVQAA